MKTIVCLALLVIAGTAEAHDVPGTAIFLDVGERVVSGEVQLPRRQLLDALHQPHEATLTNAALRAYLTEHLHARADSGATFTAAFGDAVSGTTVDDDAYNVPFTLTPPAGASARKLTLHYDGITHEVVTHNVYVLIRHDLLSAKVDDQPELAGLMHYQRKDLVIDRSQGSRLRGFMAAFQLGMRHIAEGTDHLLFLLMLLLSASFKSALRIITAFTIGHSATLLGTALFAAKLPVQPVEVAIAVSILLTAIHAVRPIFPGREALVAGSFGLIHGLAFATTLAGFGFEGWTLALGGAGFNLGIEAMQLAITAVALPLLLLAQRVPAYRFVRLAGASCGAAAAMVWIVARA